jgi:hypothetical protein
MEQKTRITSLNVAVAQLTSTLLLPIICFLIGTIAKWLLVDNEIVSKNLVITQPKTSAKISIFLFYLGLLSVYFAFYSSLHVYNNDK